MTDRYVDELYRLESLSGYRAEALVSQFCVETGAGTSPAWKTRLNPAGIGITDDHDVGISFVNPEMAARAHVVHMSGYVDGYTKALREYLDLDPRYLLLLKTDWAQSVTNLGQLGNGTWATDPTYPTKIAWRLEGIRAARVSPAPGPTPAPTLVTKWIGGTRNYHARSLGPQQVRFLVHHVTDDMDVNNVISWFQDPTSEASATFVVGRDGTIYQMFSSTVAPWTNGDYRLRGFGDGYAKHIPALVDAVKICDTKGYNLNEFCVTIEYVGKPDIAFTEAQYQAGIRIAKYITAQYPGVSRNRGGQLRHSDVNKHTRRYCPGNNFDLERIIVAIGGDPIKFT